MTEKNTFLQCNDQGDHQLLSANGQSGRERCDWALHHREEKKRRSQFLKYEPALSVCTGTVFTLWLWHFFKKQKKKQNNYLQHNVWLCEAQMRPLIYRSVTSGVVRQNICKQRLCFFAIGCKVISGVQSADAAFEKACRTESAGRRRASAGEIPKVHVIDTEMNSTLGPSSCIVTNSNWSNEPNAHQQQRL